MVLAVGSRVKDHTIDKFLGKGSYGAVYKCTRKGDGLPYAMKQINTRNMSQKERQDAVNEIRILASVVNPYVIRFCEAFVEDDMLYIITEYANHGDLFKRLQRLKQRHQNLPEDACWTYFIQLLLGVQALHKNNILHRDLKSANVFLASHNRLKIGDLGVAKLLRAQEAYAKTQIGTPYYVSPELWKNKVSTARPGRWNSTLDLTICDRRNLCSRTTARAMCGRWVACCTRWSSSGHRSTRREYSGQGIVQCLI
jgi:serine/threonine protein kinase